jgi:transcriptional regulator with XRE-family HTH domain
MESTPGKRMQIWREFKGITSTALSQATGINLTTISQAENPKGKVSNPSYDTLTKMLVAYPDLNPDWLLLGTGPMLRDGRSLAPAIPTETQKPEAQQVPADYGTTVELAITRARVADRDETILEQAREIARLNRELGKPFNGLDAAGSFDAPLPKLPTIGFRLSVSTRIKNKGAARPL